MMGVSLCMVRSSGRGYGKVILFGEHFVVYGLPGIASGIDKFVEVTAENLEDSDEVIVVDNVYFNETVSSKTNPEHIKISGPEAMFKDEPEVDLKGLKLTYNGTLSKGGGLGFSAALGVAMARAINNLYCLGWKDDKIFEVAMKWESIAHGTPSGIDPACATYGSLIWFEKNMQGGKNRIQPFSAGKPVLLVIGDTGVPRRTKEAVMAVRQRKEENPEEYEKIFAEAEKIFYEAKSALESGEVTDLGKLMNKNQELLRRIGVSSPELETMIKTSIEKGALGAKLTGAGCGGNMIALCENEGVQDKIIYSLEQAGFKGIKVEINSL